MITKNWNRNRDSVQISPMPIPMIGNRSLSNEEKNRARELQERNIPAEDKAFSYFPQSIRNKVVRNIPAAFTNHTAFYPDFLLWNEKILIEIDDWQHDYEPRKSKDKHRDKVFKENGYVTIRIKDKELKERNGFLRCLLNGLLNISYPNSSKNLEDIIKELSNITN